MTKTAVYLALAACLLAPAAAGAGELRNYDLPSEKMNTQTRTQAPASASTGSVDVDVYLDFSAKIAKISNKGDLNKLKDSFTGKRDLALQSQKYAEAQYFTRLIGIIDKRIGELP